MRINIFILFVGVSLLSLNTYGNWTEKITLSGDFRFRNDLTTAENENSGREYERNRHRIRGRLAIKGQVNNETDLIFRLATGSASASDATSTNQDLTNYGSRKDFNLDWAYILWKPHPSSQVWLGKSPVPYATVGASDLVFDGDLSSEGLSYKGKWQWENWSFFGNAGYWLLNERNNTSTNPESETDVNLVGADVAAKQDLDVWTWTLGAGFLHFNNIKDSVPGAQKGNTLSGTGYRYDYKLTRLFGEISTEVNGIPVTPYYEGIMNSDPEFENQGFAYGVKLGALKDPGSWMGLVEFRKIERDSTLGALSDGDFAGGGTDGQGLKYGLNYQVAQAASLGATYFDTQQILAAKSGVSKNHIPYRKLLLDLVFSF